MSDDKSGPDLVPVASTLRFDTIQLGPLRQVIASIPALQETIGGIATFRLVVDANFAIQELIHRIKCPQHGPSAFEELVKATVIEAHAPRWLDTEMVTAIPKAARRSRVSADDLNKQWLEFRSLLKWDDTLHELRTQSNDVCDPKDVPYVLLEQKLNADGILTRDTDISRMGGHPLTLDFVFTTRKYARNAVAHVSIRVMGVVVPTVTAMAIVASLRQLARGFTAMPIPARTILVGGGLIALLHPTSRKWMFDRCVEAVALIQPVLEECMRIGATLSDLRAASAAEASKHLQEANRISRPKRAVVLPKRQSRRTGTRRPTRRVRPALVST
jgi:predicted nucleic acid-binding protein